jgi:glycosyltransferase involved in cell wall biosynthesis
MPTVLLTNTFAELGGGELCLLDHVRFLLRQHWQVHLGVLAHGQLTSEARELGIEVWELPFSWQGGKYRSLRLIVQRISEFAQLLRKIKADLLVCYTFNDLVLAGTAARLVGVPVVYRAQGELFRPDGDGRRTWLGPLLIPFFRTVQPLVICTTRYQAAAMIEAGLKASRVKHVFLGVDAAKTAVNVDLAEGRSDSSHHAVIGMFGRLVEWKGQRVFIDALGELRRRGHRFEAWIVGGSSFGDGDEYEWQLREQAQGLGLGEDVRILGFRRDVPQLMAQCDIVCHASRFEPFGMVIVEAMMLGRPVVASDVSGPRESVVPGETGLLVAPGDSRALADALEALLADANLRTALGDRARERARQLFDLETNLRLMHEEYMRLLPKGRVSF